MLMENFDRFIHHSNKNSHSIFELDSARYLGLIDIPWKRCACSW